MTQSVTHGIPEPQSTSARLRTELGIFTFREETVHHSADELQFVLKAKVYEVRINENAVRRDQRIVMLQE
jgi:hypothetical protein